MQDFRSHISRCPTTFQHNFIWPRYFAQTKVCHLNELDLFCLWIFLNQNVLWLQVPMDYSTYLQIFDGLAKLKHSQTHFSFFQLICFNMVKELTTRDLFHNYIHILFCFICLFHLYNIWMRN